jgi:DNA-binding NarL/FixJ family response regulator
LKKILITGCDLENTQKLGHSLEEYFEVSVSCCLEKDVLGLCLAKNFDLIITDYSSNKNTGIALIKKVKEIQPNIKSILLSDRLIPDEGKIRRSGINVLIKKPLNMDALRQAINLVLV